jgi:threonine/homoserine/homoserine lactone efflux protein
VPVGQAIGQSLSFGIGVAISPVPIIAVVLMLATSRGRVNGPAFLLGWVAGLAVLGTVVLLVSSGADASSGGKPATWVSVLKLVLGTAGLLGAVGQWRGRPKPGQTPTLPKWMSGMDQLGAGKALGMGALLSDVNPKNLLITVGAAAGIAQTGISAGRQAVALAVFVLVGSLGVGIPVAIFFLLGDRAAKLLAEMRDWMGAHNAAIMAVLFLVLGTKLIGDGISGLTG